MLLTREIWDVYEPVLSGRQDPLQAQLQGHRVAPRSQFYDLAGNLLASSSSSSWGTMVIFFNAPLGLPFGFPPKRKIKANPLAGLMPGITGANM